MAREREKSGLLDGTLRSPPPREKPSKPELRERDGLTSIDRLREKSALGEEPPRDS
jgi:hypothetical protein